jgi:transcriptional regulator with XRE-family HTH domain
MNRLAERAGLSQSMVSLLERGLRTPTLDTLLRIAAALDVDLSRLIKQASKSRHPTKVS